MSKDTARGNLPEPVSRYRDFILKSQDRKLYLSFTALTVVESGWSVCLHQGKGLSFTKEEEKMLSMTRQRHE